jgi:resuscitation-promoting factor RpfA
MDKSPDAFRTISEVADHLDTPAHVLRFWESRFPQIRPVKRAGGRRYYRPSDVALLTGIKRLLHDDGLTIRGVQKILREQGVRHVAALGGGASDLHRAEDPVAIVVDAEVRHEPPPPSPTVAADHAASGMSELWPDADLGPIAEDIAFDMGTSEMGPSDLGPSEPSQGAVADAEGLAGRDADADADATTVEAESLGALLAEVNQSSDAASAVADLALPEPLATQDNSAETPAAQAEDLLLASVIDTAAQTAAAGPARSDGIWRSIPLATGEEMPLASRLRAMPQGALVPRATLVTAWIVRARDLTQRMGASSGRGRD